MSRRLATPRSSDTRFRKGQSGNPKGRPRKTPNGGSSAFDVIIDRRLTVTHGGRPREVTVEEALQHKTYQEALSGSRPARREILKMIAKREKWLAEKRPRKGHAIEFRSEIDPDNANEAMLILGIAEHDARFANEPGDPYERLLLSPWAVEKALGRRRRKKLTEKDLSEIRRCTRDYESISFPDAVIE